MRDLPKDVECEIVFLPADAGGRQSPVRSGYRPQFFYDGHDWDAIHTYPDVEQVDPGDRVRAYLTFASPELHLGKICPGTMFLLREGHKTIGYGRVIKVIDLEQSAARMQRDAGQQ